MERRPGHGHGAAPARSAAGAPGSLPRGTRAHGGGGDLPLGGRDHGSARAVQDRRLGGLGTRSRHSPGAGAHGGPSQGPADPEGGSDPRRRGREGGRRVGEGPYRATNRWYFSPGFAISISILFAMILSGCRKVDTRFARSSKFLNGPLFRSSRIAHIVFFPSPGRSSSMWKRVVIACASLNRRMNLSSLSFTVCPITNGSSFWAAVVSSS